MQNILSGRFEAQQTGLDWNTVIQNESVLGRNLVHTGSISSYKSLAEGAYNWDNGVWTGFDGSTWVAASEDILRFYMDPRNFLDEAYIFQFMSQKYDPAVHTREGLESMLKGSFMENGQIGAGNSGSSSAGPGGSSSGGSNTGGSPVVGPGVSGGSSSVPGGQSAVIVGPGAGNGSSGTSSQPSGNAGSQAPSGTSDSEVRFEGPHASVSRHNAAFVAANVITAGGPGRFFWGKFLSRCSCSRRSYRWRRKQLRRYGQLCRCYYECCICIWCESLCDCSYDYSGTGT